MKKSTIKNNLNNFIFNSIRDKIENLIMEILSKFFGQNEITSDKEENRAPLLVSLPSKFYPKFSNNSNVIDLTMYLNSDLNKFIKNTFNIPNFIPDSDPPKSAA